MPRLTKDGTPDRRGAPKGAKRNTKANSKFHHSKTCSICKKEKTLAEFALDTNGRDRKAADPRRYTAACKVCRRVPSAIPPTAKRTKKNGKSYDQKKWKRKVRRETRIKVFEYLAEKGCCDCGVKDPRVLEFDHIDPPEKKYHVSRLIIDGYSWASEKLRQEILKCRVICANCHRIRTKEQQEYYSDPAVAESLAGILKEHGYR